MDSPIPYFGGKSRLSKIIIGRIPPHKTYAEVFGGAAWILFRKNPSRAEALNDLDRHLINFYRVCKYHLPALVEEVASLQPSRELFYCFRDEIDRPRMTDVQRAAVYYYIQRYAFSGRPKKPTLATGAGRPVRCRPAVARRVLPMVAERLKMVMLENLPWAAFIKLYDSPDTFFFVDPPYIGHSEYRHNFKIDDFTALAEVLSGLKGKFLMTHTDVPKIRDLFSGFNVEGVQASYSAQQMTTQKSLIGHELLITNY